MTRLTALLIVTFVVLTCGVLLIVMHRSTPTPAEQKTTTQSITPQAVPPRDRVATLSFNMPQLEARPGGYATVDVMVNGMNKKITGVEVEASYDPKVLSKVTLLTVDPSALGPVNQLVQLYKAVDPVKGTISYIVGLPPAALPKLAKGRVVALTFQINPETSAKQTVIKLLPASMVMMQGINDSILNSAQPLNIAIIH